MVRDGDNSLAWQVSSGATAVQALRRAEWPAQPQELVSLPVCWKT